MITYPIPDKYQCARCTARPTPWNVGRFVTRTGAITFRLWCGACENNSTLSVVRAVAERFPWIADLGGSCDMRHCAVCGAVGAEEHHLAPQRVFSDADLWPTVYLCVPHHVAWHRVMDIPEIDRVNVRPMHTAAPMSKPWLHREGFYPCSRCGNQTYRTMDFTRRDWFPDWPHPIVRPLCENCQVEYLAKMGRKP